jgi:hypothetical protein
MNKKKSQTGGSMTQTLTEINRSNNFSQYSIITQHYIFIVDKAKQVQDRIN